MQRHDVQDYKLRGVVRGVESEQEHVTIAHEAIPGFMAAMQMRFLCKQAALLKELQSGDRVEGTLRVERQDGEVSAYQVVDLTVTQKGPPHERPDVASGSARRASKRRPSSSECRSLTSK